MGAVKPRDRFVERGARDPAGFVRLPRCRVDLDDATVAVLAANGLHKGEMVNQRSA